MIKSRITQKPVTIPIGTVNLEGDLQLPEDARAVILFVHGSGSSRFSPRNRFVAHELAEAGFATLLIDLLTEEEETLDDRTAELRFNIPFLASRVAGITRWLQTYTLTRDLKIGYFGASTGAAAALMASEFFPGLIFAIVSRGGRPDLAESALPGVKAPTLLIVGGNDQPVIGMNQYAASIMTAEHEVVIVPGATHLFEEPGGLKTVAELASEWFSDYGPERRQSSE